MRDLRARLGRYGLTAGLESVLWRVRELPSDDQARVVRALRYVGDRDVHLICDCLAERTHVADGARLCVHHPHGGFKCRTCMDRHFARHHNGLKVPRSPTADRKPELEAIRPHLRLRAKSKEGPEVPIDGRVMLVGVTPVP